MSSTYKTIKKERTLMAPRIWGEGARSKVLDWGCVSVEQYLPNMLKALGCTLSTTKKKIS
jgi:hypothetical protein